MDSVLDGIPSAKCFKAGPMHRLHRSPVGQMLMGTETLRLNPY